MEESITVEIPRIDRESIIMQRLQLEAARVLDIGCGEGWLTRFVAEKSASVIGIDPSATALGRAQADNNAVNASYLMAFAENLPLDRDCADIVIYFNSLHHISAAVQRQALAETARVLRQGGTLCIVEPVASGSAYELFQPVEDESAVYASSLALIRAITNGTDFQQLQEELYLDSYSYRDFADFLDDVLVVDESRAGVLPGLKDMLRERFENLGVATDGGRCYDQVHRLNLLRKS